MSPFAESYYRCCQIEVLETRLEGFLSQYPELNASQLEEVLLVDQALEWQRGASPSVEQYLQRFPVLSNQRHVILDLVCGEMRAVRALGRPVKVGEYVGRFPDLAESLLRHHEMSEWLVKEAEATQPKDQPPTRQSPSSP